MILLVPLLGLIFGLLFSEFFDSIIISLIPLGVGLFLYAVLLFISKNPSGAYKIKNLHFIWMFLIFSGIGLADGILHKPLILYNPEDIKKVEGVIIESVESAEGDRFIIDVNSLKNSSEKEWHPKNLKIRLYTDGFSGRKGDIISFHGKIKDSKKTNLSSFRLNENNIRYYSNVSLENIIKIGHSESIFSIAEDLRTIIEIKIEKSLLDRDTGDFLTAILLGDKYFLSSDVKDIFNNAGMAHILALSGAHIAIILTIVLTVLFPLSFFRLNSLRYSLAILFLWCYVFLTGLPVSAVRAAFMATLLLISFIFQRKSNHFNSLFLAAFIILLVNPASLFEMAFQLSFVCVALILLFIEKFNFIDRRKHPFYHKIVSLIIISLVTTIGTWVFSSYYFEKIPLMFLPANLILLPVLPAFMGLSLFYLLLLFIGFDLHWIAVILDFLYSKFLLFTNLISGFGKYTIDYRISLPVVIIWLVGVVLLGLWLHNRKKKILILFSTICFFSALLLIPIYSDPPKSKFILTQHYSTFRANLSEGNRSRNLKFRESSVCRINYSDCEFISINCKINQANYNELYKGDQNVRKYLLIGRGADVAEVLNNINHSDLEKIIIHSSHRDKVERMDYPEIISNKFYWIKEIGPLEID